MQIEWTGLSMCAHTPDPLFRVQPARGSLLQGWPGTETFTYNSPTADDHAGNLPRTTVLVLSQMCNFTHRWCYLVTIIISLAHPHYPALIKQIVSVR